MCTGVQSGPATDRLVAAWSPGCSLPGADTAGRGRAQVLNQRHVAGYTCRLDGIDQHGRARIGPDPIGASRTFSLLRLGFSATTVHFGLLIRGFGVRVPGGAPVIK